VVHGISAPRARSSLMEDRLAWIRDYARSRIDIADSDGLARLSPGLVLDFGAQGLFGPHLPEAVGGLGLPVRDALRLVEQVASIDVTLASFLVGHYTSTLPLFHFGRPSMRDRWVPLLAQGRQIGALALTEPGAGSNPRALSTRIRAAGPDRFRIDGTKVYIGSAAWAGLVTVFGRHAERPGISAFAIPGGTPGVVIGPEAKTLGVRALIQSTVVFRDVEIRDRRSRSWEDPRTYYGSGARERALDHAPAVQPSS
jgi:alkylation response protein AidB-like acyl-CoA dehydrogenase